MYGAIATLVERGTPTEPVEIRLTHYRSRDCREEETLISGAREELSKAMATA
jgi:hypothetical protein